jgi:hypothetical protein
MQPDKVFSINRQKGPALQSREVDWLERQLATRIMIFVAVLHDR